ncbi:glutamate synthase large subunit [Waterburya agarophytonicola K14]|uniref:glutamate synthase (ferredoxin) n=1 Tax=Waterburya agarophytonicola KI4 TaxID=2874699 RepID=A0A964BLR3_9CYAN|nr:glutamate synthase large subunit [Waterburya agarophytonicola]MCC0175710.1 glutamate synthase large subunit [Waterburya agarophytonicola KI4]
MKSKKIIEKNTIQSGLQPRSDDKPFGGQRWLVEERDACGVGFIAYQDGRESNKIVVQALKALGCMEHRGGCSADRDSGDGAGIMTALPQKIFASWFSSNNISQPAVEAWGVGMVFLPQDADQIAAEKKFIEDTVRAENLTVLGWRKVPVKPEVLGEQARANQPHIEQIVVTSPEGLSGDELDRKLYIARSRVGKKLTDDFYICSFSCRTIVYKGMVRSVILGEFYQDLTNPDFESTFAVYHRRFSTNTMPKWPFAQPMRILGHNGEINTLLGNINWMSNREKELVSNFSDATLPGWTHEEMEALTPIVNNDNSDSYNLDSAMELLVRTGRSIPEAAMILVPEAYKNQPGLQEYPEIVDFYEYHSGQQEPWDGPALLVYSDGKTVGASLDRNGLRPARYTITKDGYVVVGSETGVVDLPDEEVVEKGRLGPGQTIVVDLKTKEILRNWDVKQRVAQANPYGEWVKEHRRTVEAQEFGAKNILSTQQLLQRQTAFGYTAEDLELIIQSMAIDGKEPTFCMGDDIPLAVLSNKPRLLYDYFKQRFAQVTNPAIDPLRESLVMSLSMQLGAKGNLLNLKPEDARMLKLESPIINDEELSAIESSNFKTEKLSTLYKIETGPNGLRDAVTKICQAATDAVKAGVEIIILSDRSEDIGTEYSYIPPLLAVGAVHHHLIRQGIRLRTSLVVDTAQCWSTHHYACLIGYGASAVCPYLTLESVRQWWNDPKTQRLMANERIEAISLDKAQRNYRQSIEAGLLKILSKMGISLLSSYHGAQIFEALGLGVDLVDLAFAGTTSRLGGLTVAELAQEVIAFHHKAFPELESKKLENYGFVKYKKGGEYHMNSPEMSKALHKAVASKEYDHYELYKQHLQERPATALRDLLDFKSDRESISIDEVESVESIFTRFCTGGMSLGSLSREAHETLAVAMNRIGGKSNSGEGGEDTVRFKVLNDVTDGKSPTLPHLNGLQNGDTASSAIKQVASGRFGVTPEYLMSAKQIEIKLAQGAKPGEGGQLPGKKVSPYIASLRRSKPGVTLISPPPHHDIYSIEDLAQLIFDLHQINPAAKVSVKLVAEIGIGTIAAGVAKANSDVIQISGHDGGTGASPLSSIKHAGTPWELGLTEVHRVLLQNKLRDRVLLRADGGLKTGWDVIMAALMGAEEYGFGSIAMIAEGCIMARVCHMNTCPVGVATQQQHLRDRFKGVPENVVNFFFFVAEEVRQLLAKLGYRSLNEIIGRADLLVQNSEAHIAKTSGLDLSCLIDLPNVKEDRSWLEHGDVHTNDNVIDDEILADPNIAGAIANQGTVAKDIRIINTDRSVGGRISGAIASEYGNSGFEGELTLIFKGSAGQSFGAFNLPGMKMIISGEANDYVGKGMHGGEIIISPSTKSTYDAATNVIIGNTCLYGATGGALYANGRAGERFAVRNSMGKAVIEGAGDHCCEYMTGGLVVVLGEVGRNVGAGMTGGLGYFLDENGTFASKVNPEIVKIQRVVSEAGANQLKEMIQQHVAKTGSAKGKAILADWDNYLGQFWQVVPPSEADRPEAGAEESKTLTSV